MDPKILYGTSIVPVLLFCGRGCYCHEYEYGYEYYSSNIINKGSTTVQYAQYSTVQYRGPLVPLAHRGSGAAVKWPDAWSPPPGPVGSRPSQGLRRRGKVARRLVSPARARRIPAIGRRQYCRLPSYGTGPGRAPELYFAGSGRNSPGNTAEIRHL